MTQVCAQSFNDPSNRPHEEPAAAEVPGSEDTRGLERDLESELNLPESPWSWLVPPAKLNIRPSNCIKQEKRAKLYNQVADETALLPPVCNRVPRPRLASVWGLLARAGAEHGEG